MICTYETQTGIRTEENWKSPGLEAVSALCTAGRGSGRRPGVSGLLPARFTARARSGLDGTPLPAIARHDRDRDGNYGPRLHLFRREGLYDGKKSPTHLTEQPSKIQTIRKEFSVHSSQQ